MRDSRVSLSTIYRTLSMLRQLGVIRAVRLGEGHLHFEYGSDQPGEPGHSHLLCRACDRVIEFTSPLLDRLKRDLQRRYSYHLGTVEIEVTGTCIQCLADDPATLAIVHVKASRDAPVLEQRAG